MATKILVADDEPDVLLIIKTGLTLEGFDVVTAPNGRDALLTATEERPNLIILDVMMPYLSGFEVLEKLKENDDTAQIPVIMLTGLSDRESIQQALLSGSDRYIVKPFEFTDLLQKVKISLKE
jgi:DNA-binding response OmpR family regulator